LPAPISETLDFVIESISKDSTGFAAYVFNASASFVSPASVAFFICFSCSFKAIGLRVN
jgi:hypothetical protein